MLDVDQLFDAEPIGRRGLLGCRLRDKREPSYHECNYLQE
jgi:hypothetical protein